ncbi:hypothetical protein JTE90_024836 [Oedothorax gibbosus]|uniref:RHD domain-containing protein n=1 Tax=Oedothorax gibbosus TaxID=931172 RepID=A0AAV6U3Y7_9ARAC|nr:hypothetical protein JTE90_024836 [Oedothorax gibbosus]
MVDMELLAIENQPCDLYRFRYKSENEKGHHGPLKGSCPEREQNFPTVKLLNRNYSQDEIKIKASLYTNEQEPRPHVLALVGKNCKNGECWETISKDGTAVFRNLEIESKIRSQFIECLMNEKIRNLEDTEYDEEIIKKQANEEYKLIKDFAVLCFEAFMNGCSISQKLFSRPIKNDKAPSSNLKIIHMSRCSGSWEGGEDVILLCEKLKKADKIEINFYTEGENDVLWKENGIFNQADMYHQVTAILFKTPKFQNNSGGEVFIKLHRPSDEHSSKPRKFNYIPDENDSLRLKNSKKRKLTSEYMDSSFGQTHASPGYKNSSPAIPMEDDSTIIKPLEPNVSHSTFNDIAVGHEVVAATSNINECIKQFAPENDKILSDNDSPVDDEFNKFLNECFKMDNLSDEFLKCLSSPDDLDNYLTTEQSSEVKPDAAEPNDLYSEFGGRIVGNMEENALFHPILPQSFSPICQTSFTSDRDKTTFGKISAGIRYTSNFTPEDFKDPSICEKEKGMKKVASYIRPFHDYKTDTAIPKNGQINAAANDSLKPLNNKVYGECGLCSNMNHLSIKEKTEHKKTEKDNASMELTNTVNAQYGTNKNNEESKGFKNEFESNRGFEYIKEGINCILKNREEEVYLQYFSKLMSVVDEDGNTFLHLAVKEQNENLNLIAKILKTCPDFVNKQNNLKETPLHLATKLNAYKVVLLLLLKGGNSSIVDANGNNCFHLASKLGFTNSMKILLLPVLKHRKHISSIDETNYEGLAPVHLAVLNNSKECLKLLLRAGADVNIKERKSGSSPLHFAMKNQPSHVRDLLCHPNINLLNKDFDENTFVHILCKMKGVPFLSIHQSTDLINWAHKTLALPSIDTCKDSSASSDTDGSNEEIENEEETLATSTRESSYLAQSAIIKDVDQNSINKECEEKLLSYLDEGSHWRKLGLLIVDEKTLNGLETLSKNLSPSGVILKRIKDLYTPYNKQTLINILTQADLKEAVKILN